MGARELAQPSRTLAALPEDMGSIPGIHIPVPGDPVPSSGLQRKGIRHTHDAQTDIHAGKTPIKNKLLRRII